VGCTGLDYSISRWHVDRFWAAHRRLLRTGRVLDVGGASAPTNTWDVVNPDPRAQADYVCRLEDLAVAPESYDVVRMSEVLEHTLTPYALLVKARALVPPGGHLLLTVPFIYRLHGPDDYGRWPLARLVCEVQSAGFRVESVTPLGGAVSVLLDLAKQMAARLLPRWTWPLAWLVLAPCHAGLWWERRQLVTHPLYHWTTGWGCHAVKA
jgi:SAM-dependent methyltransferase